MANTESEDASIFKSTGPIVPVEAEDEASIFKSTGPIAPVKSEEDASIFQSAGPVAPKTPKPSEDAAIFKSTGPVAPATSFQDASIFKSTGPVAPAESSTPTSPSGMRIPLDASDIALIRNTYKAIGGGAGSIPGTIFGEAARAVGSGLSGIKSWWNDEKWADSPDTTPDTFAPLKENFLKSIQKEADGSYSISSTDFAGGGLPQGIKNEILRKQLPKLFPGLTEADYLARSGQAGYVTEDSGPVEQLGKSIQQMALAVVPLTQFFKAGIGGPGKIPKSLRERLQKPEVDAPLKAAIEQARSTGKNVPVSVLNGAFKLDVSPSDSPQSLRQAIWEQNHRNAISFYDEMLRAGSLDTGAFFGTMGATKFAGSALSPVASKIPSLAKPELATKNLIGWAIAPSTQALRMAAENPAIARTANKIFSQFPSGRKYLQGSAELLGGAADNALITGLSGGSGQDILAAALTGAAPGAAVAALSGGKNIPKIVPDKELMAAQHLKNLHGDRGERFADGRVPIPKYLTEAYGGLNPEGVQLRLQGLIANEDIAKQMRTRDPRANQELIVNAVDHPKLREAIDRAIAVTPRVDEQGIPMNTIEGRRIGQAINDVIRQADDGSKVQLREFLKENTNLAGYDAKAFFQKLRDTPMLAHVADVIENQYNETSVRAAYSHALIETLSNMHEGQPQNTWAAGLRRTNGQRLVDIGESMHAEPEIRSKLKLLDDQYDKHQNTALKSLEYAQEELSKLKEMYPNLAKDIDSLQNNLIQTGQQNIPLTPDVAGRLLQLQRDTGEQDIAMQIKRSLTKYSEFMDKAGNQVHKANELLGVVHHTAPVKPPLETHEAIIQQMLSPLEGYTTRQAVEAYFSKNLLKLDEAGPHAAALQSIISDAADDIQVHGSRDAEKYNPATNPAIAAFIEEVPGNKKLFEDFYKGMKKLSKEAEILEVLSDQAQELTQADGHTQTVGFLSNLRRASNDFVFEHNLDHLMWLREESQHLWDYHSQELHLPDDVKQEMFNYLTGSDINRAKLVANPNFTLNTETAIQNALNAASYIPRQMLEALDEIHEAVFKKKLNRELFIGEFINPFNDWGKNNDFAKGMLDQVKVQDAANFFMDHKAALNGIFGEGWLSTGPLMEQNIARNAGIHIPMEAYAQGIRKGGVEQEKWVAANLPTNSPFFRRLVMDKKFSRAINVIDGVENMPAFLAGMTQEGVYYRTDYGNAMHRLLTDDKLNKKFQFEMSNDNKKFVHDFIFDELLNAETSRGEVSPARQKQLSRIADQTYTYLRNSELYLQDAQLWKDAFEGHTKVKAMDYDLWKNNKKIYEENNARTGVTLMPYKWREKYVTSKKKLHQYDALEFSMDGLRDPDRTNLFGSNEEGQLRKAHEIELKDEIQNPAEQILRKAHKVFMGGSNAHYRYYLEEKGAILKSMNYLAYGRYAEEAARNAGNPDLGKMKGVSFAEIVNQEAHNWIAKFPKPIAILASGSMRTLWQIARIAVGKESIGAGLMRWASMANRLRGSMFQAAAMNPPDYIRNLPIGAYEAAAFTHAVLITVPWTILRSGFKGMLYDLPRQWLGFKWARFREANVSAPMQAATQHVLNGYRDSGRSAQLRLVTELAQMDKVVGIQKLPIPFMDKGLPTVQFEQIINGMMGIGTRLFVESPEIVNSKMVLERHAKVYEQCLKEGTRDKIYTYLSERLAQPEATLWQVATDTEKAIKEGNPYGENAIRFLQNSHLATLTRFGPLAAPMAVKALGQFLPGAVLFYNSKVAVPSMLWSQFKGIKNGIMQRMPGTHLPVETVSAISHVFSNIIMVSAAMAVWQHGIPKPWADMVREENDSDFLRTIMEGAMRVFGINLDKMAPLSIDAVDPTKNIRGTSFLPVNWLPMGRAAMEYIKTLRDDPRIAKLKDKEQELIIAGDMEEVYKVRAERQRIADIDSATRIQRLFNIFEKSTGIPFIALLKDSLSPTNIVYAIANDRLNYQAISAQRLADATKKEGLHDFAFTDADAPYMALRTWLGLDPRTGQSYAFDYQKFYDSIKSWMWEDLPEPMQDYMASLFAGYALELHDKLYRTDMYFNALSQNGAFPGPGTSITQNFVQDMKRTLDRRGEKFRPADPYDVLEHTENLQRAADIEAGKTMQPKAQPKEVDSTWLEGVWDRLQGRSD